MSLVPPFFQTKDIFWMKMNKELEHNDQFLITLYLHTLVLEKLIDRILQETNSKLTENDLINMSLEISDEVNKISVKESLEGMRKAYESIPFDPKYAKFKLKDHL